MAINSPSSTSVNGANSVPISENVSAEDIKPGNAAVRERVGQLFVHPLHMQAFEKVSRENNIGISVREAGKNTIEALGQGNAAKGHNILEKTIKESSVKKAYGASASAVEQTMGELSLKGTVGQWGDGLRGVKGVYVHNRVSGDDRTFSVDTEKAENNELLNELVRRNILTKYTGDYDMHDIIYFDGGKGAVPVAGSDQEENVKTLINKEVAEVDPARPFDKEHMNVIRHGPQVNFVDHMWKNEFEKVKEDNGYIKVVAEPGPFPIAMVHQGEWSIFENKEDLFGFYEKTGTPIPEHWRQDFVDRGNGMVATPEHAAYLDRPVIDSRHAMNFV